MTWSRITISARAAMPFSRPTSFERLARNFESFRKPRTGFPILFHYASLNRNEGRHEAFTNRSAFWSSDRLLLRNKVRNEKSAVAAVPSELEPSWSPGIQPAQEPEAGSASSRSDRGRAAWLVIQLGATKCLATLPVSA